MDKTLLATEITRAMREHDKRRLSILRLVKNELDSKEKESGVEVSAQEVLSALRKVLKQTGETLEASTRAGTDDERTSLLQEQVDILEGYLPEQVTGSALEAVVERVIADNSFSEKREMGTAIGLVVEQTGGNCDKAEVARLVGGRLG